jgi:hypothetical protein
LQNNPEKKTIITAPFREFEHIAYEELALKQELSQKLGLTYLPTHLVNVELFHNKF